MKDIKNMPKKNSKVIFSFLGLPASGKGTQANILAKRYDLNIVGGGDLIRRAMENHESKEAVEIKARYDQGIPQPDRVIIKLMKRYLSHTSQGVIIDNFPFSIRQAKFLTKYVDEHPNQNFKVVYFKIEPETAIKRVTTRKICKNCGEIYGGDSNVSQCAKCGTELTVRSDDNAETMAKRIQLAYPRLKKVLKYYALNEIPVIEINAERTVAEIARELEDKINE